MTIVSIEREYTNFEDLNLPNSIYKYRTWNDKFHKSIITKKEVFFAPPSSFEDKLDCKIPIRYDLLTKREIYARYFSDSLKFHPNWSRKERRKWARELTKTSPIKDKKYLDKKAEEDFIEYDNRVGILALTANPSRKEMWESYSDEYKGFCVGFDPYVLFRYIGGGGPVQYVEELPIIYPRPRHSFEEQRHLQVFSKLKKWSYEEEYRTLIFDKNGLDNKGRIKVIPIESYKEVIIGMNIDSKSKLELIDEINKNLPLISIKFQKLGSSNEIVISAREDEE